MPGPPPKGQRCVAPPDGMAVQDRINDATTRLFRDHDFLVSPQYESALRNASRFHLQGLFQATHQAAYNGSSQGTSALHAAAGPDSAAGAARCVSANLKHDCMHWHPQVDLVLARMLLETVHRAEPAPTEAAPHNTTGVTPHRRM
mmetsp:Transcript_23797/g.81328  ORF Transcript_23797/g.81328 Transcript_23797/m.81328 type:complete len:145 (-) Transcript_23797:27-461(-)